MYIQYINLLDKSFRVNNVFLDEQEQFRVFVVKCGVKHRQTKKQT